MDNNKRKQPMTPERKWTQLVHYLKDKDKQLVQLMRLDAQTPGFSVTTALAAVNKFALLGLILDRVEQLERGQEDINDTPHRSHVPKDEPY